LLAAYLGYQRNGSEEEEQQEEEQRISPKRERDREELVCSISSFITTRSDTDLFIGHSTPLGLNTTPDQLYTLFSLAWPGLIAFGIPTWTAAAPLIVLAREAAGCSDWDY
jgi:hypothetical protein